MTPEQTREAETALESQIQSRIFSQLQRPMRLLFTIRFVGLLVIGLVGVGAIISSGAPAVWSVLAALVLMGILGAMSRGLSRFEIRVSDESMRATFVSIVVLQSIAIAITGGLQSPLVVAYVPSMILSAVVSGRVRTMGPAFLLAVTAMATFYVLDAFAPGALPSLSIGLSRLLLGITVIFASGVGATAGLVIRRAFEGSVRAEALARAGSIDMLRARNSELKELGSALAHELKNPLAAIQGLTMQQLRHAEEGSRDAERLAVVVSEVKRMSKVLEDFLSFARPFAGVDKAEADLVDLVGRVLAMYRDHLDGLGITATMVGERSLVAPCDTRQLDHVLVNLLLNALDVSEPGSHIVFELRRRPNAAIIELHDEGPGLADAALDCAFDPGFTTRPDGTGLGLAISRGIVHAHSGTLTLENRPAGGCTARIELPLTVES